MFLFTERTEKNVRKDMFEGTRLEGHVWKDIPNTFLQDSNFPNFSYSPGAMRLAITALSTPDYILIYIIYIVIY